MRWLTIAGINSGESDEVPDIVRGDGDCITGLAESVRQAGEDGIDIEFGTAGRGKSGPADHRPEFGGSIPGDLAHFG